jgi:hypothetical protein
VAAQYRVCRVDRVALAPRGTPLGKGVVVVTLTTRNQVWTALPPIGERDDRPLDQQPGDWCPAS